MGNTHYLSDEQERYVLHALETQSMIDGDREEWDEVDLAMAIEDKIRSKR